MTNPDSVKDSSKQAESNRQGDNAKTETGFTIHTLDTAPEESQPLLAQSIEAQGRIAGLHAVMAEAPGLLVGYRKLHELFQASSLNDEEITVVWQAINVEHSCHYCVPAHTAIAKAMKVDDAITEALRNETPLPTERLEALRTFALAVVRERGLVDESVVQAFLDAGFTHRQVLEVILGVSQKVMSNYTNHLANTPIDRAFQRFAWEKKTATLNTMDLDRLDPELAMILADFPAEMANINRGNVNVIRDMMNAQVFEPAPSAVQIEQRTLQTANPSQPDVRVVIYRTPSEQPQAGLIWFHGGGYIVGSAEDDRARKIAEQLDCAVFSVDYRLAPEDPFPAGIEDCQAALLWAVEYAKELGIDATRVAIGGASAGAGMAAGLAQLNRDQGGPALAMQLLLYPMLDNLHDTPSGHITNNPVWNRETSLNAWEMYLDGVPGTRASPYAAASRANDMTGLPPAYAEDLFRDENIEYARRLNEAGVPAELTVYPGLFHGADVFMPTARLSQRLDSEFIQALSRALSA